MIHIVIQFAADKNLAPKRTLLRHWAKVALNKNRAAGEIVIRIVAAEEMVFLNATYRQKNKPTNVLSFPLALPETIELEVPPLGDIVICADIVNQEAKEQGKSATAHWAHMIVHGVFHLLGYDHETGPDAAKMEALEIEVLHTLGFASPYEKREDNNHYE